MNNDVRLSSEQSHFLEELSSGKNIFLTGKAGTGKSFIVKYAIDQLRSNGKNVIAVAPTGIAANNIGGQTVHSMFAINPFGIFTQDKCNFLKKEKRRILEKADVIFIDEVSMLRPDVLDAINWTLAKNKLKGIYFKQIVFVGDLKQLPVVLDGSKTQTRRITGKDLQVINENPDNWSIGGRTFGGGIAFVEKNGDDPKVVVVNSPYGNSGDQLWVRETFFYFDPKKFPLPGYCYKASADNLEAKWITWKSSIHMSRIASRIDLKINNWRIERLQDISEEDSTAEGVKSTAVLTEDKSDYTGLYASEHFRDLWDSINGEPKKDGTIVNWESNPWVIVVDFTVIE